MSYLWKDSSLHFVKNHKWCTFRAFETARASSIVYDSFQYARFTYLKSSQKITCWYLTKESSVFDYI
jgi:hypothetical protein